ncbi:MAG: SpoIIE family protein phosphatase [Acidimicrobiales bacterium]
MSEATPGDGSLDSWRESLQQELRSSRDSLRLALVTGGMGTWTWDRATDRVVWDAELCELFNVVDAPSTFDAWLAAMPPDDRALTKTVVAQAVQDSTGYRVLRPVPGPDGEERWVETRADAIVEDGAVTGLHGVSMDVTEREGARLRAERLAASADLLASAGALLATTLDPESVLRRAIELAVPALGDACEVATLERGGTIRRRLHVEGVKVGRVERRERQVVHLEDDLSACEVIRTGKRRSLDRDRPDDRHRLGAPEDDTTPASFDVQYVEMVPMVVRGEIIGALSVARRAGNPPFDEDVTNVIAELASRAALCFDNARLYARERHIADTLQRTLVPPALPSPAWLQLAGRSWVPVNGVDVGGDFYDAIVDDNRALVFVGDVCGKGVEAAGLATMARHTLRTALTNLDDLSASVEWLHRAVVDHAPDSFLTLVAMRFEADGDTIRGEVLNAGHPRAVVLRASGSTEVLDHAGTPVGIGIWEPPVLERFRLHPGDATVAYTDGVTDIPGDNVPTAGDVRAMLGASAATSAEAIAVSFGAQLDARLPRSQRTDDIALVVVRAPSKVSDARG